MPDITMCTGRNIEGVCPIREQCYRYTAVPNPHWQSYMHAPIAHEDKVCESFRVNRTTDGSGESL